MQKIRLWTKVCLSTHYTLKKTFLKCFKNIASVCALFADSFQILETCETFWNRNCSNNCHCIVWNGVELDQLSCNCTVLYSEQPDQNTVLLNSNFRLSPLGPALFYLPISVNKSFSYIVLNWTNSVSLYSMCLTFLPLVALTHYICVLCVQPLCVAVWRWLVGWFPPLCCCCVVVYWVLLCIVCCALLCCCALCVVLLCVVYCVLCVTLVGWLVPTVHQLPTAVDFTGEPALIRQRDHNFFFVFLIFFFCFVFLFWRDCVLFCHHGGLAVANLTQVNRC